jgi:hypothetical protein
MSTSIAPAHPAAPPHPIALIPAGDGSVLIRLGHDYIGSITPTQGALRFHIGGPETEQPLDASGSLTFACCGEPFTMWIQLAPCAGGQE